MTDLPKVLRSFLDHVDQQESAVEKAPTSGANGSQVPPQLIAEGLSVQKRLLEIGMTAPGLSAWLDDPDDHTRRRRMKKEIRSLTH